MAIDRLRLRAALRIRENYVARAMKFTEQFLLDQLVPYDQALQAARDVLRQTANAGTSVRTLQVRQQLHRLVQTVRDAVTQVLVQPTPTPAAIPDLRSLLAEFRQLDDEFDEVNVDCRAASVTATTEPITLEGVYLGPFRIHLHWKRLVGDTGAHSFELEALESNPSASNEDVPHPHVNNGGLCAGDGALPIARALQQGRLADAFLLVRHVLTTYNASSVYVSLDDWNGSECEDCGRTGSGEQIWACQGCDHSLCAECTIDCVACETVHCRGCLIECEDCAELHCATCLASRAHACNHLPETAEDLTSTDTVMSIATTPMNAGSQPINVVDRVPNPEITHDMPELAAI